MSGNKVKRHPTFYLLNHESGVPEVQMISTVAEHIGVSMDDFIRGAAIQTAAGYLLNLQKQQQEGQVPIGTEETESTGGTEAVDEASDSPAAGE